MAKRKFDESKVKRDESGRFVAQAGIGKQHDIKAVMRGLPGNNKPLSRSQRLRVNPNSRLQGTAVKAAGKGIYRDKKSGSLKTDLKSQKQNRQITGYGFTNVR